MADIRLFKIRETDKRHTLFMRVPNARFWIYWNNTMTKITVPVDDKVELYKWAPHEEGWSSEYEVYEHRGDHVVRSCYLDGRDCDGRIGHEGHSRIGLAEMLRPSRQLPKEYGGVMAPKWERISSSRRDYEAERMGY